MGIVEKANQLSKLLGLKSTLQVVTTSNLSVVGAKNIPCSFLGTQWPLAVLRTSDILHS